MFTLYAVVIDGGREFTPADRRLLRMADDLRTDWLTDVLKVVTDLGALPIVIALSLPVLVVLASKRHFAELVSLVVGVAAAVRGGATWPRRASTARGPPAA